MAKAQNLVFHNSAYDVPNLCINGLMTVEQCNKVIDTMIYARLAWPDTLSSKTLESLCGDLLGLKSGDPTMTKIFNQLGMTKAEGYRRFDLDRAEFIFRAAMDGLVTARILDPIRDAAYSTLTENHPFTRMGITGDAAWELVEREQIINRLFLRRSAQGLRIDPRFPDEFRRQMHHERRMAVGILEQAGVTPSNANQLVAVLDKIDALPPDHPRTPKTGKPSTAKDNLAKIDHPVARAYVRLKEIEHVQSDYLDKCLELAVDGRVHPNTDVLKAVTGRMAMGNPAFHQFPSRGSMKIARNIVLADDGDSLTSLDWSQIEPVVAANIADDTFSLAEYESDDPDRGDMYAGIANQADISRNQAKVTLLAQLYGQGFAKLAEKLNVTVDEAKALKQSIWLAMPKPMEMSEQLRGIARAHQKVPTLSGRILPIRNVWAPEKGRREVMAYLGINYLVQGSAYDVLAEALIKIEEAGLGDHVYLGLHDELVVSTSVADDIQKIMEDPPPRLIDITNRTPVLRTDRADLGERWAAS